MRGRHPGHVIDAGTGDGRIPAVLVSLDPTRLVYGIEADLALYAQAVTNLQALAARGLTDSACVHLIEADYCDLTTYETRGIALRQPVSSSTTPMATRGVWHGSSQSAVGVARSFVSSRTTERWSSTSWSYEIGAT